MEHAKSVDESIRFCLVTLKLISGQETPVTLPGGNIPSLTSQFNLTR